MSFLLDLAPESLDARGRRCARFLWTRAGAESTVLELF
jgi:hypothetical protein